MEYTFDYAMPGMERLRNQDEIVISIYLDNTYSISDILDPLAEQYKNSPIGDIEEIEEYEYLNGIVNMLIATTRWLETINFKEKFHSPDPLEDDNFDQPQLYCYIQSDKFR